jgi:acylphosphatase
MVPGEVQHEVVHFSGRVQGVGFRYSVLQVAKEYDVTGYVQNLTDGRVLLEVEGEAPDITELVEAIEERMAGYVRQVERSASRRPAQFSGFTIR